MMMTTGLKETQEVSCVAIKRNRTSAERLVTECNRTGASQCDCTYGCFVM